MINSLECKNNLEDGLKILTYKNKIFLSLVQQIGPIEFNKRELNFESLIRIIINQQLSNHVAKLIFSRLKDLCKNYNKITPDFIFNLDFQKIRNQGISNAKVKFIKDLSNEFLKSPNLIDRWFNLNDENALIEIQKLNGFGPWSGNIILLFYMGRPNVFPFGDTTLKKAYSNIYNQTLNKDLVELDWAEPYRSIVALYFWRWVDNGMIKIK
jgi:DNA-3-methyladenine glycosylase II